MSLSVRADRGRPGKVYGTTESILLQFTTYDEHPVAFGVCTQLLRAANALEALSRTALCKDHVDFEAIADLSGTTRQREVRRAL